MDDVTVRAVGDHDVAAVQRLNAANEPAVGPLDDDRVLLFRGHAGVRFDVAVAGGEVVALFVGLPEGVPYASPNYRWFGARHARFAYVDRVAVAPSHRGTGLAQQLYGTWAATAARAGRPVVCAEVNVEPPNPRSLAYHARLGFLEVGRTTPCPGTVVAMLEAPTAGLSQ